MMSAFRVVVMLLSVSAFKCYANDIQSERLAAEAFCRENSNTSAGLENCKNNFNNSVSGASIEGELKVLCYDKDYVLVKIKSKIKYKVVAVIEAVTEHFYEVEIKNTSIANFTKIAQLPKNTTFLIRAYSVNNDGTVLSQTKPIKWTRPNITRTSENMKVPNLISTERHRYDEKENSFYIEYFVEAAAATCIYRIGQCCYPAGDECHTSYPESVDINEDLSFRINGLRPDNVCDVFVESVYPDDSATKIFTSKMNCSLNNIHQCHLGQPEDLKVTVSPSDDPELFDVKATWNRGVDFPDQYEAVLTLPTTPNVTEYVQAVNTTSTRFRDIPIDRDFYVSVKSISMNSYIVSSNKTRYRGSFDPKKRKPSNRLTVVLSVGCILGIALLAFFTALICITKLRRKRQLLEFDAEFNNSFNDKRVFEIEKLPFLEDGLELDESCVTLGEILGEGAFGVVRRGWLHANCKREVAVKMLKDFPSNEDIKQFYREMETMSSVGSHAHVLSMLGCVTASTTNKLMIVVEFCSRGDLHNYLKCAWELMASRQGHIQGMDREESNMFVNRLYHLEGVCDGELTSRDLLSFCRQIAMGMEYLSQNRVVHRDLAARNVLVCDDKSLKIADFGLSRDIYQNLYKKTGGGKLPLKWMAIESITHQMYTTMSDVWSFGVVMWEITTLGGTPYADIHCHKLVKMLSSGYRMSKPPYCTQQLYDLMVSCWQRRPKDRPTFTDLYRTLDKLLHSECASEYLSLEFDGRIDKQHDEGLWEYFKQITRYRTKSQPSSPSVKSGRYMRYPRVFRWASTQQTLNHYSLTPKLAPK